MKQRQTKGRKLDRISPTLPQAAEMLAQLRVVRPPEFAGLLGFKTRQGLWRAIQRGDVPQPLKHPRTGRNLGWPENVVREMLVGTVRPVA